MFNSVMFLLIQPPVVVAHGIKLPKTIYRDVGFVCVRLYGGKKLEKADGADWLSWLTHQHPLLSRIDADAIRAGMRLLR